MRILIFGALGTGLLASSLIAQSNGTALVRHAPTLNGNVEGSIHQMSAENTTLNGSARVTGDLFVPGTPTVRLNGSPTYGGTQDDTGSATPTNHTITLNGGASLGHVVRRTDAITLPTVAAPPQPAGTRNVSLNNSNQSPGDFSTLKNLTLNGNVGAIAVPPGSYGDFTANGSSRFTLGVAGATTPAVYNFQHLTLNGSSRLDVLGPVVITLANGVAANGSMGSSVNPAWLALNFASGGLTLNGNVSVHGHVTAPSGTVTINGNSQLVGGLMSDRLVVNGNALLKLIIPPDVPPPFPDGDHDGMDDGWETAHGLNPLVDDANLDNDRDGISNLIEFQLGLKPNNPDTDGDGLYDGDEIALGRDPTVSSPDTIPPIAPTGSSMGAVATDSVTLNWLPATDDLKVSGYIVYRDGQPIETDVPIRGTTFTDANLPDGEEFAYQVRAFDYAGNLSPLSQEILVTTVPADEDTDGLPDEWENKYFGEEPAAPGDDADGDGLTNLQEFHAGSDPKDFFNGVKPSFESLHDGGPGPDGELAMIVRKPDGTPWANAPMTFTVDQGQRRITASPGATFVWQLEVRANGSGRVQVYLEPD